MKIHFGPFTFDLDTRQLTQGGGEIRLSPKAFELLATLVSEEPAELFDPLERWQMQAICS